MSYKKN